MEEHAMNVTGNTVGSNPRKLTRSSTWLAAVCSIVVAATAVNAEDWVLVSTTGPSGRSGFGMVYDQARGVTLLVGGWNASGNLNDTWTWDGNTWTQVAGTGPAPRRSTSMAYDSARGVAVLFGGAGDSGVLGDTWEWDGAAWTQVASSGPSPRTQAAMAYDSGRGVCVLQSGWDLSFGYYMDTWEWDGATWTPAANGYPGHRTGSGMAYDSNRGVVVVYGGYQRDLNYVRRDTYEWDGSTWTFKGEATFARALVGMNFDSRDGVCLLFGGWTPVATDGTWEWNGGAWTQRPIVDPYPRWGHGMVYDTTRGVHVVFGGYNGNNFFGDTWEYGAPITPGDFDDDGDVDIDDYNQFEICFTGPGGGPVDPGCEPGDFDGDNDIDCDDWNQFVLAWTQPGDPPELPQCAGSAIPAASEWGLLVMTLLMLVAGVGMLRRRQRTRVGQHAK